MENNQRALDWLEDNLIGNPHSEEDFKHNIMIWGQAKKMEKEQKLDFASKVLNKAECSWTGIVHINESLEDIYNETYGK